MVELKSCLFFILEESKVTWLGYNAFIILLNREIIGPENHFLKIKNWKITRTLQDLGKNFNRHFNRFNYTIIEN